MTTPPLLPPSTLVFGPPGSGKTTSLITLLRCGLKLRVLATEPTTPNRIIEEAQKRNISTENFDWQFISPAVPSWDSLIDSAKKVNTMTLKMLADLSGGIAKTDSTQWIKMLQAIQNFRSDKTGKELGDATEWGPDCVFAVDGFTGISTMSRNLTVGLKPNPNPGEWGVMQGNILDLWRKLTADCKCFFVTISHIEREMNELTGTTNLTVSTLGSKLAPKIPGLFTTAVLAKRVGTNFLWSTIDLGVDSKPGDLPMRDDLAQDFYPIIEGYRKRQNNPPVSSATPAEKAAEQPATVAQP